MGDLIPSPAEEALRGRAKGRKTNKCENSVLRWHFPQCRGFPSLNRRVSIFLDFREFPAALISLRRHFTPLPCPTPKAWSPPRSARIFPTRRPQKARWLHTETAAHRLSSLLTQHLPTRTHAPRSDRYCKQKYLEFIRGFPGYFLTGFMHGCSPLPRCCSSASSHAHTSTRSGRAVPWWDAAAPCPASLQAKGKEWDEIFFFYCWWRGYAVLIHLLLIRHKIDSYSSLESVGPSYKICAL